MSLESSNKMLATSTSLKVQSTEKGDGGNQSTLSTDPRRDCAIHQRNQEDGESGAFYTQLLDEEFAIKQQCGLRQAVIAQHCKDAVVDVRRGGIKDADAMISTQIELKVGNIDFLDHAIIAFDLRERFDIPVVIGELFDFAYRAAPDKKLDVHVAVQKIEHGRPCRFRALRHGGQSAAGKCY